MPHQSKRHTSLPGIADLRESDHADDRVTLRVGCELEYVFADNLPEDYNEQEFKVFILPSLSTTVKFQDLQGKYVYFEPHPTIKGRWRYIIRLPGTAPVPGDYRLVITSRKDGKRKHRELQLSVLPASIDERQQVQATWDTLEDDPVVPSHTHLLQDISDSGLFARLSVLLPEHVDDINDPSNGRALGFRDGRFEWLVNDTSAAEDLQNHIDELEIHRVHDDTITTDTNLWSAWKIDARIDEIFQQSLTDLTGLTTDELAEGINNLYFTEDRVIDAVSDISVSFFDNDAGYLTEVFWGDIGGFLIDQPDLQAELNDLDLRIDGVSVDLNKLEDDINIALDDKSDVGHVHAAADITTGAFADARIAVTNVTQHQTSINHNVLHNYNANEHRPLNDSAVSTSALWSSSKITDELSGKAEQGVFEGHVSDFLNPHQVGLEQARLQNQRFAGAVDFDLIQQPDDPMESTVRLFGEEVGGFETLQVLFGDGNKFNLFRDSLTIVRNWSGNILSKGTLLYPVGVSGEILRVDTARHAMPQRMPVIGIAIDDIDVNANGRMQILGLVRGLDTSEFEVGDTLWAGDFGTLVNIEPEHPIFVQKVATVIDVDPLDGKIHFFPEEVLNTSQGTRFTSWRIGARTSGPVTVLFEGWARGTLTWDPTAAVTQVLQNQSGTIALLSDLAEFVDDSMFQEHLDDFSNPHQVDLEQARFRGNTMSGPVTIDNGDLTVNGSLLSAIVDGGLF